MVGCLIAEMRNGKLYMRSKKTKKCKKQGKLAQDLLDSVKTRKIIYK